LQKIALDVVQAPSEGIARAKELTDLTGAR